MQNLRGVRSKHSCSMIACTTSSAISLGNLVGYGGWWSCLPREISSKNGNLFHFTGIYRSNLTSHPCWRTWPGPCGWSNTAYAQHRQRIYTGVYNHDIPQNLRFAVAASIYVHCLFSLWIPCSTRIWRYWISTRAEYGETTIAVCHDSLSVDFGQPICQFCISLA